MSRMTREFQPEKAIKAYLALLDRLFAEKDMTDDEKLIVWQEREKYARTTGAV